MRQFGIGFNSVYHITGKVVREMGRGVGWERTGEGQGEGLENGQRRGYREYMGNGLGSG